MSIMTGDFTCRHSAPITRRTGPDIGCSSSSVQPNCNVLLHKLKDAALPEFGVPDDPLEMPHSVLVKIQSGGLTGLQHLLAKQISENVPLQDIADIVTNALANYDNLDKLPVDEIIPAITSHKIKRRRK